MVIFYRNRTGWHTVDWEAFGTKQWVTGEKSYETYDWRHERFWKSPLYFVASAVLSLQS